ncbi:NADH-quinone oxidoreductase subunit C [Streptomyces sp. NBC_01014]|uniref:NADH-quinone oxidoreductase subunit C n=1 Tax=Streptomyces sp. NBC_01014 TaxID=2903719 RepID=UPI00386754A0|nr:NADH-quinone oxidoreductase subunit C [Streptomyces sp. NBC_01014]
MTHAYDRLPEAVTELFGADATAEHSYDLLTVDVPAASWISALETARDRLGCTYFDWLSAVDEPGTGFRVCAHVVALEGRTVRRLLVRTTVPHSEPVLPSAVEVYAGASWHERETHEMFGVAFTGHPHLVPLLLPENFEGHPLRKDFVLAARVAKAWPGAKEPGESSAGHAAGGAAGGAKRRQMLPPGVPDPNEWGPQKGQLPPAPTRPARAARAAGDRPVRRARSVSEGSASQSAETPAETPTTETPTLETRAAGTRAAGPQGAEAPADRSSEAPRTPPPAAPASPRRSRSVSEGSTSQRAPQGATPAGSDDAPWRNARPTFDPTDAEAPATPPRTPADTEAEAETEPGTTPDPGAKAGPGATPEPEPEPETDPGTGTGTATAPEPDPDPTPDPADPDPRAGGDTA